jgi:hypothetical protein
MGSYAKRQNADVSPAAAAVLAVTEKAICPQRARLAG